MMPKRKINEDDLLNTNRGLWTLWRLLVEQISEKNQSLDPPKIYIEIESRRLLIEEQAKEMKSGVWMNPNTPTIYRVDP